MDERCGGLQDDANTIAGLIRKPEHSMECRPLLTALLPYKNTSNKGHAEFALHCATIHRYIHQR
jgi:hypothetical protein